MEAPLAAWDRPTVDLDGIRDRLLAHPAEALGAFDLHRGRLPLGVVHAEAIHVAAARPEGFAPLAPGSAWSASGRTLAVVDADEPGRIVHELAQYAAWAALVRERLSAAPELASALREGRSTPAHRLELACLLDVDGPALATLEAEGALRDVGWMAARPFCPVVRVEAALRPSAERRRGERAGEALATRVPADPAPALVAEDPIALELASPYARDLGHALHAWGLENAARLRTRRLAEALRAAGRSPDPALASLVVADLFAAEPEAGLLEERRGVERGQGLFLDDAERLCVGHAELGALAAPDPILAGCSGPLLLLAGPSPFALEGALAALVGAGRIADIALVAGSSVEAIQPVLPAAIVASGDGFALPAVETLRSAARALGETCGSPRLVEVASEGGVGGWLARSLGLLRRDMVRGRLATETALLVALHPVESALSAPSLGARRAALAAARIALAALVGAPTGRAQPGRIGVSTYRNRPPPGQFRA